jgi:hypothetical protein
MKKEETTESEIFAQIKQSLENHEEAYIPGSWENFLQKRKQHNRKHLLRIASGIAACLLIGFLGFNYIHFEKRDTQNSVVQQTVPIVRETPGIENKSPEKSNLLIASLKAIVKNDKSEKTMSKTNPGKKEFSIAEVTNKAADNQKNSGVAADSAKKISLFAASNSFQPNKNKVDSAKTSSDTIKKIPYDPFLNLPAKKENQHLAAVSGRKVRFGINFSPGVNAAQSSGSLDYTGGLSADIKLSSKLQLSTGLQVQNQHVDQKIAGIVSSSTVPQDETKTTLINLDVPLNIIWKFISVKSNSWYVSAGVSSLVYLNQQDAKTRYSTLLVPVSLKVGGSDVKTYDIVSQVSVTQNTVTPSQTFDFAGRINLMVGFETKLSDKIFLHFEPYAKIPSPGQTSGSLNQSTTGINFKISF